MPKTYANFKKMLDARKAIEALKEKGYASAYLDASDKFLEEYSAEINFAGTTTAPSLSGLVLKSKGHIYNIDKGALVASNPMVSGMGCYKEIEEDANTRLIVNVDESKQAEVSKILEQFGGTLS